MFALSALFLLASSASVPIKSNDLEYDYRYPPNLYQPEASLTLKISAWISTGNTIAALGVALSVVLFKVKDKLEKTILYWTFVISSSVNLTAMGITYHFQPKEASNWLQFLNIFGLTFSVLALGNFLVNLPDKFFVNRTKVRLDVWTSMLGLAVTFGVDALAYWNAGAFITDVCSLPPAVYDANCSKDPRRYSYDNLTGKCFDFDYGSCGGNGNNFSSSAECNQKCAKSE